MPAFQNGENVAAQYGCRLLYGGQIAALHRRQFLSGAQILDPLLFQQYYSGVLKKLPAPNFYVIIILIIQ